MEPKEKAKELYFKYLNLPNYIQVEFETGYQEDDFGVSDQYARQAAIISVDGIINELKDSMNYMDDGNKLIFSCNLLKYWMDVKHEMSKL